MIFTEFLLAPTVPSAPNPKNLSSKDVTPAQILSVYDNLELPMPKDHFTIGIVDDVTFTSLPEKEDLLIDEGSFEAKFFGLGADGTVGANKTP